MNEPIIITEDPALSPEARKLRQQIQADIDTLDQDRERLATDEGEVASASGASLTEKHLKLARGLPLRRLDLMRRELVIRYHIQDAFYPLLRKDRVAYYEKLLQDRQRTCETLTQKLLGIGYLDGPLPGSNQHSLTRDMLDRHPEVFALTGQVGAAFNRLHDTSDAQQNRDAIERLLTTMQEAKQRALSSVA